MSYKDVFSKIGLVSIIFLLFLIVIDTQVITWATLNTVDKTTANIQSLQLMWTTLVAATLIQGFVIFSALLGANLQFSPQSSWFMKKFKH
ncbi:MAG: hypothetical protein ACXAEU_18355 [Candidatus Hodarchaeales archaeon]|jgi:hypothetical protein